MSSEDELFRQLRRWSANHVGIHLSRTNPETKEDWESFEEVTGWIKTEVRSSFPGYFLFSDMVDQFRTQSADKNSEA